MATPSHHESSLVFGLIGNIVSFLVFLSPLPTFYKIFRRKSSEGFQSIPYVMTLFSASVVLYYAVLKTNAYLIIGINGVGCVIQTIYLLLYVVYATKKDKIFTLRLVLFFNIGCLGLIVIFSLALLRGAKRLASVGWTAAAINVAVFVAPLSIIRRVIKTRSVEFMPISLSVFLTLNAITWFFYGFLIKDYYISCPNVLGFIFGTIQIILYMIFKNAKKEEPNAGVEMNTAGDMKQSSIDLEVGEATN